MFDYQKGIKLREKNIWLDPTNVVETACVSHGHADHIRRHKNSFATPATASFMRRRLGTLNITEVNFNQPFEMGPYRVTFLPAGHILGSAQIFVEHEKGTLLYSGDFKLGESATAETIQIQKCDILIMECTYGHPKYRFPRRSLLENQLCEFVHTALRQGQYPLIFSYTLGKAQEVMKILSDAGFALSVHGSILHLAEVYQRHGISFGDVVKFKSGETAEGRAIILPPHARRQKRIQKLHPRRTLFVSGWGMDESARYRYGVDQVLPLSDHADFDGLLQYIEQVEPKKIYTTHGPKDYYLLLRERAYDAYPLVPQSQGDFFM
ncbi:MAG: MBL fold metallo-hydrolase [Calditrichaeota bacterium]|nr:MAG: MBL fold metallo-hydrolase [Calditrichota bacterium]